MGFSGREGKKGGQEIFLLKIHFYFVLICDKQVYWAVSQEVLFYDTGSGSHYYQ